MVVQPGNRVARRYPLVPGIDLAGTVTASDDPLGARRRRGPWPTATTSGSPTMAASSERARVPAGWIVPLPEGVAPGTR